MPAIRPDPEVNFMYFDGKEAGFLKSVEGGSVSAEVINEPGGPGFFVKKHLGAAKYEEFALRFGLSMNKAIYDWIAASWKGDYTRKNGALLACDYQHVVKSEREFLNALLTATTIPAMDGSSKEPAYLTVRVKPELVRYKKGSGQKISPGSIAKLEQKAWLPSNFRLEIPGLDCKFVTKIDSFTVKQTFTSEIGVGRDFEAKPGKLEFPNLTISISETHAQSWIEWHNDFVIMGKNSASNEKTGALIFFSPDMSTELGRIDFYNLGIFRLNFDAAEADQLKYLTAELYCNRMEFQLGK
jgi:T4-like virus tail tube protein gp19